MEEFNFVGFKLSLYLGANPNIDAQTKQGYPLVTRCARSGEPLFLDTLLRFGGDVNANEKTGGYLPIHMAATKGMDDAIQILINHGANINSVYILETEHQLNSGKGWTPLVCACNQNKELTVKKLLELGANPFDINDKGVSIVDICLKFGNKELANYILEKQKEKKKKESYII